MPNLYSRITLNLAFLLICMFLVWPPGEKLKLGKDLAGGTSMVYTVQFDATDDQRAVMGEVIKALKDRVDPQGVLEISIRSLGSDRIEITMPLPRQEVKDLREAFEKELERVGKFDVTGNKLATVFTLAPAERETQMRSLTVGNNVLYDSMNEAAKLFDARDALDKEIAALPGDAPLTTRNDLVAKRADINPKYREATGKLLSSVLPPEALRRVITLPRTTRKIEDRTTNQVVTDPSQYDIKLGELMERYPLRRGEIEGAVTRYAEYLKKRKTLDDPQDLMRLLRGSGVLSFRIPITPGQHPEEQALRAELQEKGPGASRRHDARWFKINQITNWYESVEEREVLRMDARGFFASRKMAVEPYLDGYYALCWDTDNAKLTKESGDWTVAGAGDDRDQFGKPCIRFEMDLHGGLLLGEMTRMHIGDQMAVLLDDEIYTAPTLQSSISTRGQITGINTDSERQYIIKVLAGGSLQAKLSPEPISTTTQSPDLGADNLAKGIKAGLVALVAVGGFMILYYFTSGVIAVVALGANALVILGMMALQHAAYTMPGIAGMILTFGMAVDANVLIYERIREELRHGNDLRTAVRLGFSRAFASIFDGNIANLLVCAVLGIFGSAEVRGFAITMSVGVLGTLYAGLVLSRLIFDVMLRLGWKKTSMLPMAIPGLQKVLTPRVNWLKWRWYFFTFSTCYVILGIVMAFTRGEEMLDTEFRGGTQVELVFKPTAQGAETRLHMTRAEVEARVDEIGESSKGTDLARLVEADVIAINPQRDGVTSSHFKIKTIITDSRSVLQAIQGKFQDMLETEPPLSFAREGGGAGSLAPAMPIQSGDLGTVINRNLAVPQDVRSYRGGVAILLDNLEPKPTARSIRERLDRTRQSSTYSDTLGRTRELIVLKGDDQAVESAVIVVLDPGLAYDPASESGWKSMVASREGQLVLDALAESPPPASVQSFSPSIAATFKAQAILAMVLSFILISIYIWVRFNSARYAFAALIALVHDVLVVVGLVAVCGIMFKYESTAGIARSLMLLPFKLDLNMVAAMLTVAGYSLNDTIIIMDRIREHRGKSIEASEVMINSAINQTISRTLITSGMTLLSAMVLYIVGGEGVRAFSFALLVGIGIGTYSSIAVAAPIVWVKRREIAASEETGLSTQVASPAAR